MKYNFLNIPFCNIHSQPSTKSEISSQILYGEKFRILNKKKNWIRIQTSFDRYKGFIKLKKFNKKFSAEKKICKLKSKIYNKINNKYIPTNKYLFFSSGIAIKNSNKRFLEFEKNKWIKIRTTYDNYVGYIKKNKFFKNFKPINKINKMKSRIYIKKGRKLSQTNNFLFFASGVPIKSKNKDFIEFENNRWVKKKDTKLIDHYEK